ncbi:hypothetical protein [Nocardia sp. NPDC049149]|uniref:hypothetical protein n=1 Tax=Nocardia sp. NPDC049149 TaxID=3364315 RepID=UPI0037209BCD
MSADSDAAVEFCCPIDDADIADVAGRFPDMATSFEPTVREAFIRVPKVDMMTALGFESLHQWLIDHNEQATWTPRQIFLLDPAAATSADIVYELAVPLR